VPAAPRPKPQRAGADAGRLPRRARAGEAPPAPASAAQPRTTTPPREG
jgi:hypothetical protein